MPVGLQAKPTDEDVIAELIRHRGKLSHTAKALGVNSSWIRKRINEEAHIRESYQHSRDELVDLAEDTLVNALKNGSERAAMFVLTTLGKDRGFTERVELTGKNGGDIEVTLNLGRRVLSKEGIEQPEEDNLDELEDSDIPDNEQLT